MPCLQAAQPTSLTLCPSLSQLINQCQMIAPAKQAPQTNKAPFAFNMFEICPAAEDSVSSSPRENEESAVKSLSCKVIAKPINL